MHDPNGEPTGVLIAKPNATILYATLAKGPKLPPEYQKNSTRHFMREVNRLGVTGVIKRSAAAPERNQFLKDWRRERNWDPTVSEFASPILLKGEERGSNCDAEIPRQFERRSSAAIFFQIAPWHAHENPYYDAKSS